MSVVQKIDSEVLKKLGEVVDAFRISGHPLFRIRLNLVSIS